MPSCGGPVYQPTTVSYEPRSGGGNGSGGGLGFLGPASSIGVGSPLRIFRKPKPQLALLLFALISLAAGIAMLANGAADWIEDQEFVRLQQQQAPIEQSTDDEVSETQTEAVSPSVSIPLGILLGGVFMTCLGIVGIGLYLKVADWRRNCVCPCPCPFFDKKQSLARQLQCQNVDGGCGQGIMALNPSTDHLVSHTQYAPVSELPSLRADDEERRNLMPDNKDWYLSQGCSIQFLAWTYKMGVSTVRKIVYETCEAIWNELHVVYVSQPNQHEWKNIADSGSSAEESDRMLEPDPRIVLRPVGRVEDA